MRFRAACVVGLVFLGGCDPEEFVPPPEEVGPRCTIEGTERFLPIATGTAWSYTRTDLVDDITESKTQTVGPLEDVGGDKAGQMAFRLTTVKDNGSTVSWQEDTGTAVVRHREQDLAGNTEHDAYYEAAKLRIDEADGRLGEGLTYSESYVAREIDLSTNEAVTSNRVANWTVEMVGEQVVVPAGTFCTMQLRRETIVDGEPSSDKQYWFARGVGKVKERSPTRREELLSVTRP